MSRYCLVGVDGNAFSVMGYVANAMKETEFSKEDIKAYREDCMSGNYNELLVKSMDMIEKCNEIAEEKFGSW